MLHPLLRCEHLLPGLCDQTIVLGQAHGLCDGIQRLEPQRHVRLGARQLAGVATRQRLPRRTHTRACSAASHGQHVSRDTASRRGHTALHSEHHRLPSLALYLALPHSLRSPSLALSLHCPQVEPHH